MSPTARPTDAPQGDEHGARQDRRLFVILLVIIAGGLAAMALLAYGTA